MVTPATVLPSGWRLPAAIRSLPENRLHLCYEVSTDDQRRIRCVDKLFGQQDSPTRHRGCAKPLKEREMCTKRGSVPLQCHVTIIQCRTPTDVDISANTDTTGIYFVVPLVCGNALGHAELWTKTLLDQVFQSFPNLTSSHCSWFLKVADNHSDSAGARHVSKLQIGLEIFFLSRSQRGLLAQQNRLIHSLHESARGKADICWWQLRKKSNIFRCVSSLDSSNQRKPLPQFAFRVQETPVV